MLAMIRLGLVSFLIATGLPVLAQTPGPLRIEINRGVIEPMPVAITRFVAESDRVGSLAEDIGAVIASDLSGSGLFRAIPEQAFISGVGSFDAAIAYADWKAINAQALVTGSVNVTSQGRLSVKFRLHDVYSESQLGDGLQLAGRQESWRRIAHKVADAIYSRITGEGGYFDSRVVFVSEQGPKGARDKRLAIMDYDGANAQFLTNSGTLVLSPRISPKGDRVIFTTFETGFPRAALLNLKNMSRKLLEDQAGTMSFAPRFSPDGNTVVLSLETGGNTDLYLINLRSGRRERLTSAPSIETAPSYSPDGSKIVFESDRSGSQQIYVMDTRGGEPKRISFGNGRYGTPVWSPRGDLVAFTKQASGRFHIGVMRIDGSGERLLTASFLDEGPTWSPNGRVIMFTRETRGSSGAPALYSVDITGRNLKRVSAPGAASAPAWSPLLE